MFPIEAFVGMVSDEVEILRGQGYGDDAIAQAISRSSKIAITGEQIAANYAPPELRHQKQD
jgi:hypothetical protein